MDRHVQLTQSYSVTVKIFLAEEMLVCAATFFVATGSVSDYIFITFSCTL